MSKSNRDCLSCKNNNNIQDRRISKVEFSINPKLNTELYKNSSEIRVHWGLQMKYKHIQTKHRMTKTMISD